MQGSRYLPRAGANLRFHDADGTNALTRLRFAIREGGRTVGAGVVTEVIK